MVHVRYDGRSFDLSEAQLGVVVGMTDGDILNQIARHFDVADKSLESYVVDRPETGDLVIRPEAVYG